MRESTTASIGSDAADGGWEFKSETDHDQELLLGDGESTEFDPVDLAMRAATTDFASGDSDEDEVLYPSSSGRRAGL
jgi:hypothetical protein